MPQIRDPIHGSIEVSPGEMRLIDGAYYQRLRNIKQLGFTDLAFPGGTHTRYAHGIGAMAVASRVFDSLRLELEPGEARRIRQALRLAVLFHDVGHAPLSHASETIMPPRKELKLPEWTGTDDRRANHEDYTLKILLDSEVARVIEEEFGREGISPSVVASLVASRTRPGDEGAFRSGAVDYAPLLRQVVSSELDADRMDYLARDSYHTGVTYGRYDVDWLAGNLSPTVKEGKAYLALGKRAIFAFEDFLLSRYHMFVSVYYHYTPICFDNMLQRYYREAPGEYVIPADVEAYLEHDDVTLTGKLRESKNRWAVAITRRRPWRKVAEANDFDRDYDLSAVERELAAKGIEAFRSESKGVLSKYFGVGGPKLFVHDPGSGKDIPIEQYTPLYERYSGAARLTRIYVDPERGDEAAAIARRVLGANAD